MSLENNFWSNGRSVWSKPIVIYTFYYSTGSVGEHRGFIVVAVSMKAVNLILGPKSTVDIVLASIERLEVYQHYNWAPRHKPTPDANFKSLACCTPTPVSPQSVIFLEERVILTAPKIGTDENYTVGHSILQRLGTRGEYRIYASHFIAYLPTRFKNIIGVK